MRVSRRGLAIAIICLSNLCLPNSAVAQSDQIAAERILGRQWRKSFASRRDDLPPVPCSPPQVSPRQPSRPDWPQFSQSSCAFVWTARSRASKCPRFSRFTNGLQHGPCRTQCFAGQHILLFLYPPSRLGFTTLVGGALGQIALDAGGKIVAGKRSAAMLKREATLLRGCARLVSPKPWLWFNPSVPSARRGVNRMRLRARTSKVTTSLRYIPRRLWNLNQTCRPLIGDRGHW